MAIEFRCRVCAQLLRVADEHQGRRAKCPNCEAILDIPSFEVPAAPLVLARSQADVIDYELFGGEHQYVEITLDPEEIAIARADSVFYMSPGIDVVEVDHAADSQTGLMEKLGSMFRNATPWSTLLAYRNVAAERQVVAFAPTETSRLLPLHLDELGGAINCHDSAILCVARGIDIMELRNGAAAVGGHFHRLAGNGVAVLAAAGSLAHRVLKPNQKFRVRADRVVAAAPSVHLDLHAPDRGQAALATLTGPGEIWLRSGGVRG